MKLIKTFYHNRYYLQHLYIIIFSFSLLTSVSTSGITKLTNTIEAEKAIITGGATKVADPIASGGFSIELNKPGQAITFAKLSDANKLAIRYASVNVGTITIVIDNQPERKVNIHASGSVSGFFLYAIID